MTTLVDTQGLLLTVQHVCGHAHTWNNRYIDPKDAARLQAYQQHLSRMVCPGCYTCACVGESGRPS